MNSHVLHWTWAVVVSGAALLAIAPVNADVPLVYATIEPKQITLGESAELRITSLANGAEAVRVPVVPGLQFEVLGRSHQFEITNGVTLSSTSLVVRVTPQLAGVFTIPPVTPKAQPLVLQVNADHGSPSANASKPGNSNYLIRPPILPNAPPISGIQMSADGAAFIRLTVPKRAVYVGESVPLDIQVGMRSGFVTSLNGLPALTGGEFTLSNLSHQPERQETTIDNKPFVLMTWHSVLAAIKPGAFSLSVEAPLTVKISTRPKREAAFDDLLGDPFMQNFFGPTISKDITVASPAAELTVSALPTEGRPANFSGAVGSFKITSDISPDAGAAGDPLTLRLHVTGSGNFDRVDSSMLGQVDHWKTYPPKSNFTPGDAVGFKGEKNFEQPLIAANPGTQTLPGLAFSYFDPRSRRYETVRSSPVSVKISPSLADGTLSAPKVAANASAALHRDQSGLRPDHSAGRVLNTLVPLYMQARFLVLPSVMTLGIAAGLFARGRRRLRSNDLNFERSGGMTKSTKRVFAQLEAAARSSDTTSFFETARSALLRSLAVDWQVPTEQITAADVDSRLGDQGEEIRRLLNAADEARYAGERGPVDFSRWTEVVRRQLIGGETR